MPDFNKLKEEAKDLRAKREQEEHKRKNEDLQLKEAFK